MLLFSDTILTGASPMNQIWPSMSKLLSSICSEQNNSIDNTTNITVSQNVTSQDSLNPSSLSRKIQTKIMEVTLALRKNLKVPHDVVDEEADKAKRTIELLSKLLATHVRPCSMASSQVSFAVEKPWCAEPLKTSDIKQLSWKISCAQLEYFEKKGFDEVFWNTIKPILANASEKPISSIPCCPEEEHYYTLLTNLCMSFAKRSPMLKNQREQLHEVVLSYLLSQGSPECHLRAVDLLLHSQGELPIAKILYKWRREVAVQGQQVFSAPYNFDHTKTKFCQIGSPYILEPAHI